MYSLPLITRAIHPSSSKIWMILCRLPASTDKDLESFESEIGEGDSQSRRNSRKDFVSVE